MRLFSRRHARALASLALEVNITDRLRRRLRKALIAADTSYEESDPYSGYTVRTTVLEKVKDVLVGAYGEDELSVYDTEVGDVVSANVDRFVLHADGAQVLDALEACWNAAMRDSAHKFQAEVNIAFEEEACPWRLADGQFFQVDTDFLEKHVLENANILLSRDGFHGAQHEFVEARNDLAAGDYKDAILKACMSMESVLKVLLQTPSGNARDLVSAFQQTGAFDDVPEDARNAVANQVFMSLPTLRNKLAGHGQGGEVVALPQRYALLAIRLAAVFNAFLIDHHVSGKQR